MLNNHSNFLKVIYFSVIFSVLMSCNEQSGVEECPFTIDAISIVDQKKHGNKIYYLTKRITGWQDKSIIIQLFDQEPKNDRCNRSLISPIIEDSLIPRIAIKSFEINLENKIFLIEYNEKLNSEDGMDNLKLKFINAPVSKIQD